MSNPLQQGLQGVCVAGPASKRPAWFIVFRQTTALVPFLKGYAVNRRAWKWADWGFQGRLGPLNQSDSTQCTKWTHWPVQEWHTEAMVRIDTNWHLAAKTCQCPGRSWDAAGDSPLHHHCDRGRHCMQSFILKRNISYYIVNDFDKYLSCISCMGGIEDEYNIL